MKDKKTNKEFLEEYKKAKQKFYPNIINQIENFNQEWMLKRIEFIGGQK